MRLSAINRGAKSAGSESLGLRALIRKRGWLLAIFVVNVRFSSTFKIHASAGYSSFSFSLKFFFSFSTFG